MRLAMVSLLRRARARALALLALAWAAIAPSGFT